MVQFVIITFLQFPALCQLVGRESYKARKGVRESFCKSRTNLTASFWSNFVSFSVTYLDMRPQMPSKICLKNLLVIFNGYLSK